MSRQPAAMSLVPALNGLDSPSEGVRAQHTGRIAGVAAALGRLRRFWTGDVDLVPVCLFRIVYGVLLFNWIWQLWPNITPFFTNEGMLPWWPTPLSPWPTRFSVLFLTGDAWGAWLLWAIGLSVAVMGTVGFHTRLASLSAFVIVTSFTNRNPVMLDSSDLAYRLLPLWLAFTGAGNRFAVDALLRARRGERPQSRGPALPVRLLELQIAWIYLAAGLAKLEGATWRDGTAAYYALQLEHTVGRAYAVGLAYNFVLVHWVSWGTLAIELGFGALVFAPFVQRYTRPLAIVYAAALHLAILASMNVGNFPIIMLAALIPFWQGSLIERIVARISAVFRHSGGRVPRSDILAPIGPVQVSAARRLGTAATVVVLSCVAVASFATALPDRLQILRPSGVFFSTVAFFGLDQGWGMFAPNPGTDDGWLVAPGRLADGSAIDLAAPGVGMDTPRYADPWYSRWTKVSEWLSTNPPAGYLLEYGRMSCRLHNRHLQAGESPLVRFDLIYVDRIIPPPGQALPPLQRRLLWSATC